MDLVLLGLILGMSTALLAVGLTLIYMSTRVISLAQGDLGAFAVSMLVTLVRVGHLSYWLALPLALLSSAVLGAVVERLLSWRLSQAPRMLYLVATIGVSELLIVGRLLLPVAKVNGQRQLIAGAGSFPLPFTSAQFTFGRVVFHSEEILVLIVGPVMALAVAWFLGRSIYGLSIRAAAENAPRARMVGIPVRWVSTLAWTLAALLSAVAAVLEAPLTGYSPGQSVGLSLLVPALGAATIARFEDVRLAFLYGLGLGVVGEVVTFYTSSQGTAQAAQFGVLLLALLARPQVRRRTTSAEESSFRLADPVRPLPREVGSHRGWRTLSAAGLVVLVGAVLAVPTAFNGAHTLLLASICAISVVVISLTVLSGWSGQISLGHWGLAGMGGILGSRLVGTEGMPFWLAFALSGVIGAIVALAIGLPALRLPGLLLAVVTLGFANTVQLWLFHQGWFAGTGTLKRPAWITGDDFFWVAAGFLAITIAVMFVLQRNRFGRNLCAIRDNPVQAAALGVAVVRNRLIGFVVCGITATMGGFLWTAGVTAATPDSFPLVRSLSMLCAAVIGGLGSVSGAVIGTAYLIGVPFLLGDVSPYIDLISSGTGLLALVLFLPGGLIRPITAVRDALAWLITGLEPRPVVRPTDLSVPLVVAS